MWRRYLNFVRGVSVNRIGRLGVILVTSSFITLLLFELLRLTGLVGNAYIGLIIYMLFPALFIIGLILIPIGWYRYKKQSGRSTREILEEQFESTSLRERIFGSRLVQSVIWLTLINIIFLSIVGAHMLQFMDQPVFCGTACHSVMHPEWETYQRSPHARVRCVDCHVGEGVDAMIDSKLNGLYQILSVTFNLYEKPIPTPVHQLRPARETCEKCHWPQKFYGRRMKTIVHFTNDSLPEPMYTTLNLKVDAGWRAAESGIHWHVARDISVRYNSVSDEREEMIWVDVRYPDGSTNRFVNTDLAELPDTISNVRTMDCVDCHNRATHIYKPPERMLDDLLLTDRIPKDLPFIRREAMAAVTAGYSDSLAARNGIENHLVSFYRENYPQIHNTRSEDIDLAIDSIQAGYYRNVFHSMNITWNTYESQIGHDGYDGCFRCHNELLVDSEGNEINYDCELCHGILAYEEDEPFVYLNEPDTSSIDFEIHRFWRQQFLSAHQAYIQ